MADEKIEIEITLDDGSVKKGFANIKREAEVVGKSAEQSLGASFSRIGLSVKTAFAAIAGVAGGAFAFDKIMESGIEAESAVRGFNLALANAGSFTKESSASFQEYASSLERLTGVSDELILSNAGLLVSLGRLSGEGLKTATQASLDLSAGLRIGPESAFMLVSKAAEGNVAALGRYGIKVNENLSSSEKFAEVLRQIEGRFGGQAAAAAGTFEGALARLRIGFGNIIEELGKIIVRSPVAVAVLAKAGEMIQSIADRIAKLGENKDLFGSVIKSTLAWGSALSQYVIRPLEFIFNISKTVFLAIVTGADMVIAGLAKIGQAIFNFLIKPLAELGVFVAEKFISIFDQGLAKSMSDSSKSFLDGVSSFSATLAESTAETAFGFAEKTSESLGSAFNFSISESTENLISNLNNAAQAATPLFDNLKNGASSTFNTINEKVNGITQAIRGSLAGSISSGVQTMTKALMAGKNAWESFGQFIINIIGDMAISVGTYAIAQGALMVALASNPFTSGWAAIAAGVALVAIGTMLKAGAGGAAVASGGGISSGGGIADSPSGPATAQPEGEREIAQTAVTVNVQGSILDRRETGLAIADIIKESFDLNGTRLVTA